jgi:hypothetical protein
VERIRLEPRTVADFYRELMEALAAAGVPVSITGTPSEVPEPIPFAEDTVHASYEPEWANRLWRALVSVDAVLKEHRARFRGKASPSSSSGARSISRTCASRGGPPSRLPART